MVNETTDLGRVRQALDGAGAIDACAATSATRSNWPRSSPLARATRRSSSPPMRPSRALPSDKGRCADQGPARRSRPEEPGDRRHSRSARLRRPSPGPSSSASPTSTSNARSDGSRCGATTISSRHATSSSRPQARSDVVIDDVPPDIGIVEVRLVGRDPAAAAAPDLAGRRRSRLGGPAGGADSELSCWSARATRISRRPCRTCRTSSCSASTPDRLRPQRRGADGRQRWDLVIFEVDPAGGAARRPDPGHRAAADERARAGDGHAPRIRGSAR